MLKMTRLTAGLFRVSNSTKPVRLWPSWPECSRSSLGIDADVFEALMELPDEE